jgi:two-component system, cell cycle sensor histidine kinase and response regulator CckA
MIACGIVGPRTDGRSTGWRLEPPELWIADSGLRADTENTTHEVKARPRLPIRNPKSEIRNSRISVTLLAAALRAQSEGVFIAERQATDEGLRILFVNDSFCAMTGYTAAALVGRYHGVLHAEPAEVRRLQEWLPGARAREPLVGDGFLIRADGAMISVAWSFDPVVNARGRVTHVVATYRDQTEKRRLQEALVHSQRLDAVGRLAGGVAHDFNNLLSVINGYCEMLAAHVAANPQALREVAEIHHAGRKAAALTQQLLAFSRRQPWNARVINLNTLVRDNADILRRLVGERGQLDFALAENLANVRTDPAQFQQVLLNLVINARDALHDRGRIVVRTTNREIVAGLNRRATDTPPGRYVVLSVNDNGTGMDAETQKHLFEPFFTTKPEGKGTGLGLALVYGVVQQSAGFITVQSTLLVGSTFEVLLPQTAVAVDEPPAPVAPLPSMRGSESVVLIEEDEVVRKMVAGILTTDGYRVTAVKSPAELSPSLGDEIPIQLLIANVAGDVEKFARRIQAATPNLRILYTADEEPKSPLSWLPAPRQKSLTKPYALSELVRAARALLDAP